jgi:DNA topoisomerase-1
VHSKKWIVRKGTKASGFRYEGPEGVPLRDADELERIDKLRIPPAWRDVHIAANPRSAIQVWGFDVRGRKQYRYHRRAVEKGELRKHYRVRQMARDLPLLRSRIDKDFRRSDLSRERVCAGIIRIISDTFFRVGSDRYERENSTFGITTLRKSHVTVDGDRVRFDYPGKRRIRQHRTIVSRAVARFILELLKTPGGRLFRYLRDGDWCNADARDVNEYLESLTDFPYTAKDFRTWGGTLRAATVLAELGPEPNPRVRNKNVVTSVRLVAAELGNTPAICRKSYVHPVVITRYLKSGATIDLPSRRSLASRNSAERLIAHTPEERALIRFLDVHFPERRRRRRMPGEEPQ